jgi:hypothetical protein
MILFENSTMAIIEAITIVVHISSLLFEGLVVLELGLDLVFHRKLVLVSPKVMQSDPRHLDPWAGLAFGLGFELAVVASCMADEVWPMSNSILFLNN